jgi:multidrug efflux system outer membrane protein
MHGVAVLVLLTLVACAAQPLPTLTPPVPLAWRHAPLEQPLPADLHGWWKDFGDEQLNALVDRALAGNLNLAQAMARLRASRTLRTHAGDRYLPFVSARTENAINPNASATYLMAGFDAVWELGLFGRREGTRRALQGEQDDATATLESIRVSLVGEVVADYLMLGAAHERYTALQRIQDLNQHGIELLRIRQGLGLASDSELAATEGQLARSGSSLLLAQQQIDALAQQLAVLLGQPQPDQAWLTAVPFPRLAEAAIASAPADLLRTRPDIRRAEAQVLQAAGQAQLARADRLPNVGIGGSIVWSTNIITNRRGGTTFDIASAGPLINIPLFDWGQRRAQAQASSELLEAAVLAYRQAVLQGVAEVEIALGNLQRQRDRAALEATAVAATLRVADHTAQRLALSLASPLDAQAATLAQAEARLAQVDASVDHGLAYVALFKALGGAPLPAKPVEP